MKIKLLILALLVSLFAVSCATGRGGSAKAGCYMKRGYVGY